MEEVAPREISFTKVAAFINTKKLCDCIIHMQSLTVVVPVNDSTKVRRFDQC